MDSESTTSFTDFLGKPPSDDNEELGEQITCLAAHLDAGTYKFLKFIGKFDRKDGWGGAGIMSCVHWLNWKCGISYSAARAKVQVARRLENLPLINKAFAAGEISYSKVRAMTRVATDENEEYLLMIAEHGTASHMEKLVRKFQMVERLQQPDVEEQQYESRQLIRHQDNQGMWNIYAKLPPEEGGILVKAIDEVMHQQDKPWQLTEEQIKQAENAPSDSAESLGLIETASFAQRRADALTSIAEQFVAHREVVDETEQGEGKKIKTLAGHERCQLVLHVDINTLRQHTSDEAKAKSSSDTESATKSEHSSNSESSHNQSANKEHSHSKSCKHHDTPANLDKQWISPDTARRLGCDASLYTVLEDENGNVLNVGRKTRVIPPAIHRAVEIRDETCRFPGCTATHYVEVHHIQHWANGGETKMSNLVKLCRFHHREQHHHHFFIEAQADKNKSSTNPNFIFKTPSGQVMHNDEKLPRCNIEGFFETLWPDINSETGSSQWMGDIMDYGMAIDGMLLFQDNDDSD
jgi:hypothetical protein